MDEEYFKINKKRWNERVEINAQSKFYDLEGFIKGKSSLLPIEVRELGDVKGKSLLHLQCHFGMDTLSWARKGAKVTGVDYTFEAIKLAKELSEELKIPADFIETNIYDLPKKLDKKFDIVFTSYGVLCWLHDLQKWAEIVTHFLKPGGTFYIVESHPFGLIIDEKYPKRFQTGYPYFNEGKAIRFEDESDPLSPEKKLENSFSYSWLHPLGSILNSLITAGIDIEFIHEFPFGFFPLHPDMKRGEDGYFYFQNDLFNVPIIFSLKGKKK
ncbi:MAG: class I SAM-dependent methyltransferase [Candidatus Heimdallarchaeota archaeon]